MHIEIKDNTKKESIIDRLEPWEKHGFFVATVGKEACGHLEGRIFSLHDLECCAPATFVNIPYYSEYKRWTDDDSEALCRMKAETKALAKSCEKKQLYVLSEVEDLYTADQCCELANHTGEEGFSILITHHKIQNYPYFAKIRKAFDHIIFLPDDATYTAEILRWIICGFEMVGYIGVDFDDARYVLTYSAESSCRMIRYENKSEMQAAFEDFLAQFPTVDTKEDESANGLLGVWVPRGFHMEDVIQIFNEVGVVASGQVIISCLPNENDADESWTIALLAAVSKTSGNEQNSEC